jgi:serine/threonine protein kinase
VSDSKKPLAEIQVEEQPEPLYSISYTVTEKDFTPLQQLGRGSFGDVYLVRDNFPGSGKLYAMKILTKRTKHEDSWLRYIKTERDVLATSDCPFIVKLHYAFQTNKRLFLVIDFCPGGDLETLLSEEK